MVGAFAALYLIWGSTYLAIKIAVTTLPPLMMTGLRSLIAGMALYSWARLRGTGPPTWLQWRAAFMVGGLLFLVGHGGLGWAGQWVPSGAASLFFATLPLWMTLLAAYTEPASVFGGRTIGALAAGLGGILVLVGPRSMIGGEPIHRLGATVLVLAALSWSVGSALARHLPRPESHLMATAGYLLAGGTLALVGSGVSGEWDGFRLAAVKATSLAALAHLVVLGSIVTFGAYTWLLDRVSLAALSTYAFVNPIVAVLLGWLLGGEPLNARVMAGASLVIAAVVLILTTPGMARAARPKPAAKQPA